MISASASSPDRNADLFQRAQALIPGGVNSPVRAFKAVGGTPRFIERAQGAYAVSYTHLTLPTTPYV